MKIIFALILFAEVLYGQNKYDNIILLGRDQGDFYNRGSLIDFSQQVVKADTCDPNASTDNSSSICSPEGEFRFFCNGCRVMNAAFQEVENGDLMIPYFCENPGESSYPFSPLMLPQPGNDSIIYLFYQRDRFAPQGPPTPRVEDLLLAKIDAKANGGLGRVLEKGIVLLDTDTLMGSFAAVRHGNGRDWWVLIPRSNQYFPNLVLFHTWYTFLVTPKGVEGPFLQVAGPQWSANAGLGQSVFSPDGSKYAAANKDNGLNLFDFDRCTGLLSNPLVIPFPEDTVVCYGVAFSPNNRFLYVSTGVKIHQFDLSAADIPGTKTQVAYWDGAFGPFSLLFFEMALMPDNKIYQTVPNDTHYLHVIANPDEAGTACNVQQHGFPLVGLHGFSMPTLPNYRAFDVPGSICDTLGIDGPSSAVLQPIIRVGLNIVPNPTMGSFRIELPESVRQGTINVYDVWGRMVKVQVFDSSAGGNVPVILEGVADGVYLVTVSTPGHTLMSSKIVLKQ